MKYRFYPSFYQPLIPPVSISFHPTRVFRVGFGNPLRDCELPSNQWLFRQYSDDSMVCNPLNRLCLWESTGFHPYPHPQPDPQDVRAKAPSFTHPLDSSCTTLTKSSSQHGRNGAVGWMRRKLWWSGVKWVIQADKDKKIKLCCVQSKAAEPYIDASGLEREDVLRRFLFVEGPGLYHQGAAAGLKVLSYLPPPYSALSALMVMPAPLSNAVYDIITKQRYNWFGKDDDCLVLKEPELLERFVDWEELLERIRARQI